MCRNRIAVALVGGILSTGPLAAQASPATAQRTEIQQVIKTHMDAHDRSDAATIAEVYSKQPGVTSVGDGQIMRDRIREAFDQLVGTEGKFKISTGSVDIVPLRCRHRRQPRLGSHAFPSLDGQAILVKAQGSAHYTFHLPPGVSSISGRITGIAGGNKDFEAFIMDGDNVKNYSADVTGTRVLWQSGRGVVATIDPTLTGPGTYHLVVSNSWSIATDKTAQAQATAECGS